VSRLLDPSDDEAENEEPVLPPDEIHDEKRSRGSDWPLRKSSLLPINPELQHVEAGSASKNRNLSPVRGSRFLEGSMNDRASKVPPAEFIGEERLREEQARQRANARSSQQTNSTASTTEKAEAARQSGIFRFGKSVAASFNPANWKIWKAQPQQLDETMHQKALRERQEKAERIYRELKQAGKFRDSSNPPTFHVSEYDVSTVKQAVRRGKHDDNAEKHDSGIEFDRAHVTHDSTSKEEKRRGRVFLEPPSLPGGDDTHSSGRYGIAPEPSRSSVSLQTTRPTSMTQEGYQSMNLNPSPRRLRSTSRSETESRRRSLSIPSMRKDSGGSTTSLAAGPSSRASEDDYSAGNNNNNDHNDTSINPRRLRSREHADVRTEKQKHKYTQHKLVKRVSDLEIKLAAAGQELQSAAAAGGDEGEGSEEIPATDSESQSISQASGGSGNRTANPKRLSKDPKQNKKPAKNQPSKGKLQNTNQKPLPTPAPQRRLLSPATTAKRPIETAESSTRITRPRFVPGALATLPSERLLSSYLPASGKNAPEEEDEENRVKNNNASKKSKKKNTEDVEEEIDSEQIGRAVSTDYGERREGFEWPDYVF
jgi:hypothetical protein